MSKTEKEWALHAAGLRESLRIWRTLAALLFMFLCVTLYAGRTFNQACGADLVQATEQLAQCQEMIRVPE